VCAICSTPIKRENLFRTSLWESRCKTPSPLSVGFSYQTITHPFRSAYGAAAPDAGWRSHGCLCSFDERQQLPGVLAIGINPNPTVVTSSTLTRMSRLLFLSPSVMVILGAVFNALMITQPKNCWWCQNIAAGNFKRIDLLLGGSRELGELIFSFNEMAERLKAMKSKISRNQQQKPS